MRLRAMELAARLYPARWRQRYGTEFDALIEESGGGWGAIADVLRGALEMQMRSWSVWKFVAACGAIGVVIAGVASWMIPQEYVSTAVLRIDANDSVTRERIREIAQTVLSRSALRPVIVTHGLYKNERARKPFEDILRDMRAHIEIRPIANHPTDFGVSFVGGSPAQAKDVTQALVSRFMDASWEARSHGLLADVTRLEVLDPPTFPGRPRSPNLTRLMAVGVLLSMLIGLAVFRLAVWRGRQSAL